ncbi:MAG: hypothetical protein ACRDO1_06680 [Nocardioidaceae bacterium]
MPVSASSVAGTALVLLLTSGCVERSPAGADDLPGGSDGPGADAIAADDYHRSRFDDSADVAHRWYPLRPGTRLIYRGSSVDEGERLQHGVDVIVTDLVKTIDGVPNVVVWERDYTDGELVETELALFAQDEDGHIWHMGEYPEEYEDGEFVAAPAWIHGVRGATAGITIPAEPRTGTPDYAQGFAPAPLNWEDRGRVYQTDEQACVEAGCYGGVVVIEEFEPSLPDAYQDKFYAPGVGVVKVGWRGSKDESKEVLELVKHSTLDPDELAEARAGALELEDRAYLVSKDVYVHTPRSEVRATK